MNMCRFDKTMIVKGSRANPPHTPCPYPAKSFGFCPTHYKYLRRTNSTMLGQLRIERAKRLADVPQCAAVAVDGTRCQMAASVAGHCTKHHQRVVKHGDARVAYARTVDGVKVNTVMAWEMRQAAANGMPVPEIGLRFGLSTDFVRRLVDGQGWNGV